MKNEFFSYRSAVLHRTFQHVYHGQHDREAQREDGEVSGTRCRLPQGGKAACRDGDDAGGMDVPVHDLQSEEGVR